MDFGIKALQVSTKLQRFNFDEQTYTIRRNLMIVSSLAIASTFVTPLDTGKYEINMGIIKGNIDNPILLYLFLGISCLYYLSWFVIHCKRLVVRNYSSIKQSYLIALSMLNAKEEFKKFTKNCEPKFSGTPDFIGTRGSHKQWTVRANLNSHVVTNYTSMIDNLEKNSPFTMTDVSDGKSLEYAHEYSANDLVFLNIHIDQFWRTRKEEAFITLLPIGYSIIAIFLIGLHIYTLSKS